MEGPRYWHKLVRDKVPTELEGKGLKVSVRPLDESEFFEALTDKIIEEATEVSKTKTDQELLEELGDLESCISALLAFKGWTRADLLNQQRRKDAEKGTFNQRLWLICTEGD